MKKTNLCLTLLLLFAILLSACGGEIDGSAIDPSATRTLVVEVPMGSTATSVGELLESEGLVRNKRDFVNYLKQNEMVDQLKAGKYELSKAMDLPTIAKKMTDGDVFTDTVTIVIPEGFEFTMILDTLVENMGIDRETFIELANHHKFQQKFMQYVPEYDPSTGVKYRLEGYLFPATYSFKRDASELEILNAMLDRFEQEIGEEYYEVLKTSPLDFHQTVILASIIEREGADHEEFPRISGVFMNRVGDNMLFQSCATVQYVIQERKPVLTNYDITVDSPFNTYAHAGLPPGPIASPGSVAIKAAFFPEEHDYYFFVVSGKNDGKHTFSRTLEEHEAAKLQNLGDL